MKTSAAGASTVNGRFKPSYSNPHSLRSSYGTFENRNFGNGNSVKSSVTTSESQINSKNGVVTANEATIGRKVKHPKFGDGTIVAVADINGDKKPDVNIDYDKDGKYWAFYVNGAYATKGVDSTDIEAGATYSFKVE